MGVLFSIGNKQTNLSNHAWSVWPFCVNLQNNKMHSHQVFLFFSKLERAIASSNKQNNCVKLNWIRTNPIQWPFAFSFLSTGMHWTCDNFSLFLFHLDLGIVLISINDESIATNHNDMFSTILTLFHQTNHVCLDHSVSCIEDKLKSLFS